MCMIMLSPSHLLNLPIVNKVEMENHIVHVWYLTLLNAAYVNIYIHAPCEQVDLSCIIMYMYNAAMCVYLSSLEIVAMHSFSTIL